MDLVSQETLFTKKSSTLHHLESDYSDLWVFQKIFKCSVKVASIQVLQIKNLRAIDVQVVFLWSKYTLSVYLWNMLKQPLSQQGQWTRYGNLS